MKSQKQADFSKAVRRRYLPAIDQLAELIANDLRFNLEILVLQKLGFNFWLNLPHFLLVGSLVMSIAGTALNYFHPIIKEIQTNGAQIRSRE